MVNKYGFFERKIRKRNAEDAEELRNTFLRLLRTSVYFAFYWYEHTKRLDTQDSLTTPDAACACADGLKDGGAVD